MPTVPFAALGTFTIYQSNIKSVFHLVSAATEVQAHCSLPSLLSQGQRLHRQDSGGFIFSSTLSAPAQYVVQITSAQIQ